MSAVPIYDGQFQISIEGGVRYRLPHGLILGRKGKVILDAGQIRRPVIARGGQGNAFRTAISNMAISNRIHRSWVAAFRRVCHFVISLLRRHGTLIVPSARGLGRHGKTVSPGSIRQSASAYEINGAISEIAKSGLVLMGFHLDSRGPAKPVRVAVMAGRLKDLRKFRCGDVPQSAPAPPDLPCPRTPEPSLSAPVRASCWLADVSAVNFDCPRTDVQVMGSRRHQWTSI